MPLRRVGDDCPTSDADKGASPRARIAAVPDVGSSGAVDQSADPIGGDQARLVASLPASPEGDAELERLRKCVWELQEEIETLPGATRLPPIPGLPLLEARIADSGAIDRAARIPRLSQQRPRKALSALTMFLIASAIAVPVAGYFGAGSLARLVDEFDMSLRPSIDAQRTALLQVQEAGRVPENLPSRGEAERAAGTTSLQPTKDLENRPAEDEASSPPAAQGTESSPRAAEPSVTTPIEEAPSQGDTAVVFDPKDIKHLIDRGRQFFDAGDVAAARLLFNRAANAGDVTAVVAMGTTYDPAVLESRGVRGILADPQKARSWYEKAAELGSAEGVGLLKALDGEPAAAVTINRDQVRAAQRDLAHAPTTRPLQTKTLR
jgi:hypothetical protein